MAGWLWAYPDPAAKERALEEKRRKQEEAHATCIAQLRQRLQSDEGRKAGQRLVQGGELGSPDEVTSDAYLRKWLAAREWEVPLTYACILSHARWRARQMPNGYIDEAWIQGPMEDKAVYLQGCDRLGRALAIIQVSKHVAGKRDMQSMRLFTCYAMNAMMAMCDAEKNPGRRLISIFDLSNCGYSNLDIACLRMILRLLGDHYVEQLDCMVFYNPPLIVWGLWASLKHLLPDVTRNKIKFVDPSDTRELQEVLPNDVLPRQYGGAAELLLVNEAIRKYQLPPYPHLPDVAGSAGGAPPPEDPEDAAGLQEDDDAAAQIPDEAELARQGKAVQQMSAAAVAVQATPAAAAGASR